MAPTDAAVRVATCANVSDCPKARAGEPLAWYPGAGEYCPDCGEALALVDSRADTLEALELPAGDLPTVDVPAAELPATEWPAHASPTVVFPANPSAANASAASDAVAARSAASDATAAPARNIDDRVYLPAPARSGWRAVTPLRRLWAAIGLCLLVGAIGAVSYARRAAVATAPVPTDAIAVCAIPSAKQLAAELVSGYAAKTATPASRFLVTNASACAISFSAAAATPDAVIARDGIVAIVNPLNGVSRITEPQLRGIYSGKLHDWSQLGGPPGAIVPILPAADTDEGKALASSLFFGVTFDRAVQRLDSSMEVTQAVTRADRASRGAIGLVTFSQAVPAKVVPLAYWPTPSVLSISNGRYPYTLTIAVEAGSTANSAAGHFIDFARSGEGAAIVQKSGLIPREGV